MIVFKPGSYGYIAKKNIDTAIDNAQKHPSAAGVYAQQAVETMLKQYLKEVLACTDAQLLHTHNLRKLTRAAKIDALEQYMQGMWELTDAYFNTRYPGEDFCELTTEDAVKLCTVAVAVVSIVETEIEKFRVE